LPTHSRICLKQVGHSSPEEFAMHKVFSRWYCT